MCLGKQINPHLKYVLSQNVMIGKKKKKKPCVEKDTITNQIKETHRGHHNGEIEVSKNLPY